MTGTVSQAQGDLKPAGLAVYTDTSRDIYVAALLTPDATLPPEPGSAAGPIAMEYRIATRRISTRALSGTMLLQAELGSARRAPDAVIDVLEKFKMVVQDSLQQGDQIQIGLSAGEETIFHLNGSELFRVHDAQVFRYLLSGWIGDSSSALLRDSLLAGKLDARLSSQYDALTPSDERIALVATWIAKPAETDAATDAQETEVADNKPAVPVDAPAIPAVKPDVPAPTIAPEIASAEESTKPAASANDKEQASSTSEVAASTAEPAKAEQQAAAPATGTSPPKQLAKQDAADAKATDTVDDREYQRQVAQYLGQVVAKVSASVDYPRRAIERSWQGTVILLVELNENGKLLHVVTDSPSGRDILDRAAIRAVEEASPFPKLSAVAQEEFATGRGRYQLPIPVRFTLNK